ncbi:hypothetical protein HY630_00010 [Candidatus Uhrbacteria bacterium]|nr:hypothetical protein [Candidatus Uhrbacteria bacterium]
MSQLLRIILIVLVLGAAVLVWVEMKDDGSRRLQPASDEQVEEVQTTYGSEKGVNLIVTSPVKDSVISSPLVIAGEAPGFWYFEATFPLVLVNWDGLIIAQGYATAQGEWMTEEYVPFTATLEFTTPEYGETGALILQRDNPSGLPENDDAVEIPIQFAP